jgi:hypothetical protein
MREAINLMACNRKIPVLGVESGCAFFLAQISNRRSWTPVTDREVQTALSRWSIAAAAFGGVCNLLCLVLGIYKDYCLGHV